MVLKKSYVSLWKKITIIYLSFLASSWNLLVVPCCWILRLLFCWRISLCCRCQCHLSEDDVNIPVSYMTNDSIKECPLNSLTFTWLFPHLLSSLWLNDTLFPTMCQVGLLLPLERAAFRSSQYMAGTRHPAPNSLSVNMVALQWMWTSLSWFRGKPCLILHPWKCQWVSPMCSQWLSWMDVRTSPSSSASNAFLKMTGFELMTTECRSICFAKHFPAPAPVGTWQQKSMRWPRGGLGCSSLLYVCPI